MKYCSQCGAQLVDEAVVCPKCGCAVAPTRTVDPNASPKSRLITLLLCIFVGGLGIHRFYVGIRRKEKAVRERRKNGNL